jgi:hypothetical protein
VRAVQALGAVANAKERGRRQAELNKERDTVVAELRKLLFSCTQADVVQRREQLGAEVYELTAAVDELQTAQQMPLAERLQALLVGQVASLQAIMRAEVSALEDRSAERLTKAKTDAEAAAKVQAQSHVLA